MFHFQESILQDDEQFLVDMEEGKSIQINFSHFVVIKKERIETEYFINDVESFLVVIKIFCEVF